MSQICVLTSKIMIINNIQPEWKETTRRRRNTRKTSNIVHFNLCLDMSTMSRYGDDDADGDRWAVDLSDLKFDEFFFLLLRRSSSFPFEEHKQIATNDKNEQKARWGNVIEQIAKFFSLFRKSKRARYNINKFKIKLKNYKYFKIRCIHVRI